MTATIKDQSLWPLHFSLVVEPMQMGRWETKRWTIKDICLAREEGDCPDAEFSLPLKLFKDERTDYRFNLSSHDPRLFFVFEKDDYDELQPFRVTPSQTVAASFMDGDYVVMSEPLPLPVQAWMEAFIGRHGELLDPGKKKKRKGAGRASGN